MKATLRLALAWAACAAATGAATDNHLLLALPAPGPVAIDGRLDDWDASARIPVCADTATLAGTYSAWVMMMYDAQALYVGVDWCDPTPMVNAYDPALDIERRKCFHADSLQLHLRTDRESKLIGYWHTPSGRAAAIALDGWFPWDDKPIVYHDALAELGVTEAFQRRADGSGYVQELRIPWAAIIASGRAPKAGERFDCMLDLVWGPDSGHGWPVNHMMDLVAPGAVHTGWFWEVPRIYGQVELAAQGHRAAPPPVAAATPPPVAQPLSVRCELGDPAAPWFTLAIEDAAGHRVRALPGSCRTAERRVSGTAATVEVGWDGCDDLGQPVLPGTYHAVGLTRGELTATYEQCFYNPGTPPWTTADGTGAWGADHTPPCCVAAAGDVVVIGWGGVEGGTGIIGVGRDGRKRWGASQGARLLAADGGIAYFILDDFWSGKRGLGRLDAATGAYLPWTIAGRAEMPVDLATALGGAQPGAVTGLAARGDRLVLAFAGGEVVEFSAATVTPRRRLALAGAGALAFAPDGTLFALAGGRPWRLDLEHGTSAPLAVPAGIDCRALAVDADGGVVVADLGPDQQIKVFAADGRLLRTAGARGGRPRGAFAPQTIAAVSGLAVDAAGLIWATENWDLPRRVAVWGRDGTLVRDYVGNAAYAACGAYLHDQDPTRAYAGAVELIRDGAARSWRVGGVLWSPDAARGERLAITGGLATPQRFTSAASGHPREYLFARSDWGESGLTVFMEGAGGWRPVAAITLVGHLSGRIADGKAVAMPDGAFAGLDPFDGVFWNDRNGDGVAQRDECEVVPARRAAAQVGAGGEGPLPLDCGWGGRMGQDLAIYARGLVAYRPLGFAADGAPRYGRAGMSELSVADAGDLVPLDDERRLIVLSSTGYGGESYVRGLEYGTWRECWRYPSHAHGVHGSHHAPAASPGEIIGALKIIGSAHLDQGGAVFAIRGNLGQDFLMTSDGLYVGELFRDVRLPAPPLPATEAALAGRRIDDRSEGGEPFNGWFGRQSDGVVRICTGIPGQAALVAQVHGLESLRRCAGAPFTVTAADAVRAADARAARLVATAPPRRALIHRLAAPPRIDGDLADWPGIVGEPLGRADAPEHGTFRLGWDAQHLYVAFEVTDGSPWENAGRDPQLLFKTGDAVDLQLGIGAPPADGAVGAGHLRLLFAPCAGRPLCVLMRPIDKAAPPGVGLTYRSPVGDRHFDRVTTLATAEVAVSVDARGYRVEAAVPWAELGVAPQSGLELRGDTGFISSDGGGRSDVARTYWSNPATNLVNDAPSEAWLVPATWGTFTCE